MKKIIFSLIICAVATSLYAQSDSTLKEYTGRYVFPAGGVVPDVTVSLDGDQLTMSSTAGTSALTKLGIDTFTIVEFSGLAVFKRGETKTINGVYIEAAGYIMDGTKETPTGIAKSSFLKPDLIVSKN